jgi:hypothetical protein
MRTVHVVMVDILGQHRPQLPTAQDQHPIQDLPPNRAPPLRGGIRLRRPHRRAQHPDPSAAKTASNAAVNFASRSRSRNRKQPTRSSRPMSRLRACWVTQSSAGCAVTPSTWTRRLATSITTRRTAAAGTRRHGEEVTAKTLLAWARRNCRHETAERVGAGSTPARSRMTQTVLAPILKPRRHSAPWMRR